MAAGAVASAAARAGGRVNPHSREKVKRFPPRRCFIFANRNGVDETGKRKREVRQKE